MPDMTYLTVGNRLKRLVDMGDDSFAEVIALPMLMPVPWVPTTAFNGRVFADIEIQVIGTPTTAYVLQDSLDGSTYNDCNAMDRNGTVLTSITAAGRYRLPGSCYLRARQGAGSSIIIRAGN
jgi:hypothetical protein